VTEQRGLDSFARVPLLFGPSPVHRLERLSEDLLPVALQPALAVLLDGNL
jgi:hypothetical protein